jgi:hypothetical protein
MRVVRLSLTVMVQKLPGSTRRPSCWGLRLRISHENLRLNWHRFSADCIYPESCLCGGYHGDSNVTTATLIMLSPAQVDGWRYMGRSR